MFILKYRLHNIVFIQWLFTLGGKINARECLCFQGDFRTLLILTAVQLEADGCRITCNLELVHIISSRLTVVICCSSDFFSWAKAKRKKNCNNITAQMHLIICFVLLNVCISRMSLNLEKHASGLADLDFTALFTVQLLVI